MKSWKPWISSFKKSFFLHCLIFLMMIFQPSWKEKKSTPIFSTLKVDIIGLPDVLKKDLKLIDHSPFSKNLTRSSVPSPADPYHKNAMTLSAQNKRALQRLHALSKIQDSITETKNPTSSPLRGNLLSQGASVSADAREASEASYLENLRETLQVRWILPTWLARQALTAQLYIKLDSTGRLESLKLIKPSGDTTFDAIVQETVVQSQPFTPPPPELVHEGILIGFPL